MPSSSHAAARRRQVEAGGRTLELVVHHTDGDREYAYDRDPILGSGTDQILAAAVDHKWTVIDMATDWATIHPDASEPAEN